MKLHRIYLIAAPSMILIMSCVTAYKGPGPQLNKKGDEAKQEFEKFALEESWRDGLLLNQGHYSFESVLPLVKEVSTTAHQQIMSGYEIMMASGLVTTTGIVALVWGLSTNTKASTPLWVAGGGLTLAGFTASAYGQAKIKLGIADYNYELRKKLIPTINVSWNY